MVCCRRWPSVALVSRAFCRLNRTNDSKETTMSKRISLFAALAATSLAFMAPASAEDNPMMGGAPMYASKYIVENAVNSKDHTTLAAAGKAAGLVDTLAGLGPFTVFAPTNEAFGKLPKGTVDTLVKPKNKATLTK